MVCFKKNILPVVASKLPWFLSGVILGGVIAVSSPGVSAGQNEFKQSITRVYHALAELAVDTETNAARIVSLQQRVDHLEQLLKEKN